MCEIYKNRTKVTMEELLTSSFYRKTLITLFLILTTFFLCSCGGLMEDGIPNGYGRITINAPGSRDISTGEISRMTYKFYFNGTDYGSQNTAVFLVGTSLTIKIEGYVEGVLRVSKTDGPFTVQAGENYRSIILSRTADEVIPSVPAEKVTVSITLDGVSIGTLQNKSNGDDITSDVQALLTIGTNNEVNNKRYAWNTGTVTVTSQAIEIKTYCTVTAVKLTLSSDVITSDGSLPGYYKADFQGKDAAAWYNIGDSFPTPTIMTPNNQSTNNVNLYDEWGESASDYHYEVEEDLAGKTLKTIVSVKRAYLRVQHFHVTPSGYYDMAMGDITGSELPDEIPFGTIISSSGVNTGKNTITITTPGAAGVPYEFSINLDSLTSGGCCITTETDDTFDQNPIFPNDGTEDDITYTVQDIDDYSIIYLGIYWNGGI